MKKTKTIKVWATIYKKDGFDYKAGDICKIDTFRRVLAMHKSPKTKIVPCTISYSLIK